MKEDLGSRASRGEHTPGPWAYRIVPDDDAERAKPQSEWSGLYIGPEDDEYGGVQRSLFEGGFTHGPEDGDPEADARLMATAPELKNALRDVTRELKQMAEGERCDHSVGICWCETFRAIHAAETVLDKALNQPLTAR